MRRNLGVMIFLSAAMVVSVTVMLPWLLVGPWKIACSLRGHFRYKTPLRHPRFFVVIAAALLFAAAYGVPTVQSAPLFRIIEVRAEYGHLIVEVQHFNADGSHWFYENYTFQGREQFKRPRVTDAGGRLFIQRTSLEAPSELDSKGRRVYQLPAGEEWLRYNRPHLDAGSILSVIQSIDTQRRASGWTRGQYRLTTHPLDFTAEDAAGAIPLQQRFNRLNETAYNATSSGTLLAYSRPLPPVDPYISSAWGTVSTVFPDGDTETSSVDGETNDNVDSNWADAHGGGGTGSNDLGTTMTLARIEKKGNGNWGNFTHGVLLFDTAAIPDADLVTTVTLEVVVTSKNDPLTASMSMVTMAPASNTSLTSGDYDSFGSALQAPEKTIDSFTADSSTYNVITLNSTGRGNVSKTSVSKFGFMESNDYADVEPSASSSDESIVRIATAEEVLSGDKRPKLVVTHTTITAAITGTTGDGATEQEVRDGAGTVIITLTGDTWVASGGTFDTQRQAIVDGLDAAESETNGWNAQVRDQIGVSSVVRTSSTVVTITLTASEVAAYRVDSNETITVSIPNSALVLLGAGDITATPTIAITAAAESAAVSGTLGGSGGIPSEIVAGGQTVILTLTNTKWGITADFNAQRQAIFDGLTSDLSDRNGWDSLSFAVGDVVRTSDTVVTVTLTAEAAYAIPATETISTVAPASAMVYGAALTAPETFAIVPSFQSSGTRVTPAIDLSSVTDLVYCAIGWEATTPANTSVTFETSVDGGATYSAATNGSCPSGLTVGGSLSTITDFRVRVTLTTTDSSVTPLITARGLILEDSSGQELYYQLNTTPGFTITDRSGNSNPGTMSFPSQTSGVDTSLGVMSSTDVPTTATALGIPEVAAAVTGSAVSSRIFTTTEDGSFLPGGGIVTLSAANSGIPARAIWQVIFGILILVVSSVVVKLADNNLMWGAVALSLGIAFGALIGTDGIWPRWMIFIAPIPMMAMITLRKGVPM